MNRRWLWFILCLLFADLCLLWWWRDRREHRFDDVFQVAAHRYGLPTSLVKAVAWRESGFDAQARGKSGEIGLMQLMDFTAQEWADSEHVTNFVHEHSFDPGTNTLAGSCYLAKLCKRYSQADNPWPYALADYNAGRSNVRRWTRGGGLTNSAIFFQQIDYPQTRNYVRAVLNRYAYYQSQKAP